MYAIIATGGKQYKVSAGDVIQVEKLNVVVGDSYTIDEVLLIGDGDNIRFGAPYLSGASVKASVIGEGRGKKLIIFKYRNKKHERRKQGHRQPFTSLKIDSIIG